MSHCRNGCSGYDGASRHRKDSLWSWIVCLAAAINLGLTNGLVFSFGALLPVYMDYFEEGREKTAWIGSLSIALLLFFSPLAGSAVNRFCCRIVSITGCLCFSLSLAAASFAKTITVLYICYAALGSAASCVYVPAIVFVKHCFEQRKSIAIGVVSGGQSLGVVVFGPFLSSLAHTLGWRNTLRILAGLLFVNSFSGLLFDPKMETTERKLPNDRNADKQRVPKRFSFNFEVWKVPSFRVLAASMFVMMFGRSTVYVHLVKYSEDLGIASDLSSRLLIFLGINVALGRFTCGFLCTIQRINNWHILQCVLFLCGAATMLVTLSDNYEALVIYTVVFGLSEGSLATVANLQALNCVHSSMAASSFGYYAMALSLTSVSGPPLLGLMADKLGSYVPAFLVAGGTLIVGSFIPFLLLCVKQNQSQKAQEMCISTEEDTTNLNQDSDQEVSTRRLYKTEKQTFHVSSV